MSYRPTIGASAIQALYPLEAPVPGLASVILAPNIDVGGTLDNNAYLLRSPQVAVQNVPPGAGGFQWTNLNQFTTVERSTGLATGTPIMSLTPASLIPTSSNIQLDTSTPGDEHLVMSEPGTYLLTMTGRASISNMTGGSYAQTDVNMAASLTPAGYPGVLAPQFDSLASAAMYGILIPSGISGSVAFAVPLPDMRMDFWARMDRTNLTGTPMANIDFEQNFIITLTKLANCPMVS